MFFTLLPRLLNVVVSYPTTNIIYNTMHQTRNISTLSKICDDPKTVSLGIIATENPVE